MKNITDRCKHRIHLVGKEGNKKLEVLVYYRKKRIAICNWCGGMSLDKKYSSEVFEGMIKFYKKLRRKK